LDLEILVSSCSYAIVIRLAFIPFEGATATATALTEALARAE
jgi:hypothetical protein